MDRFFIVPKENKARIPIESTLGEYWSKDQWSSKTLPIEGNDPSLHRQNNFSKFKFLSAQLNNECKYFCKGNYISGKWSFMGHTGATSLRLFFKFIEFCRPKTHSILDLELEEWEKLALPYAREFKPNKFRVVQYRNKDGELVTYHHAENHPLLNFLRGLYAEIYNYEDKRTPWEKGIITPDLLGHEPDSHPQSMNLNRIEIQWLRDIFVKFAQNRQEIAWGTLCGYIEAVVHLSKFILQKNTIARPSDIDGKSIKDFVAHINKIIKNDGSRANLLYHLRGFLEYSTKHGLADFPLKRLVKEEFIPKSDNPLPDFIPPFVKKQIIDKLENLKNPWNLMLDISLEVGPRVTEITKLEFDALHQDGEDWCFKRYLFKQRKYHVVPITDELACKIQRWQEHLRDNLGKEPKYLFPNLQSSQLKPYSKTTFNKNVNEFIIANEIQQEDGSIWRYTSKQARHTAGTEMLNKTGSEKTVQRFLGHASSAPTRRYAHLYDSTLKEAWAEYHGRIVDCDGNVAEESFDPNSLDNQWLKHNMLTHVLPNGFCRRPKAMGACDHADACFTCGSFRTSEFWRPELEDQLSRAEELESNAASLGMKRQRQISGNTCTKLRKILANL